MSAQAHVGGAPLAAPAPAARTAHGRPHPSPAPEPAWRRALAEIETRLVELGFGTHIMNEMRHFAQAARHARTLPSATPGLQRLLQQRFHLIGGEELDSLAHSESKLIPHTPFLQHLHQQGRAHAQAWLHDSAALVGRRSSIDVEALFG